MLPLFLLALVCLIGLLVVSAVLRRLNIGTTVTQEPLRIPPNMAWSLLVATAALNIFAYDVGFGIGYGLFGVCVFVAILLSFTNEKRTTAVWFAGIAGIVACLFFGFRANEFVQIVNVVTALMCAGALIIIRSIEVIRWHALWFFKMKAAFLARLLHHSFAVRASVRTKGIGSSKLFTILKTAGLTCIVLFFFSAILSAADPVFDNMISVVRDQALGRVLVSAVLIGILLLSLTITVPEKWQEKVPQLKIFSFMEMFVPALSLVLLFGLFLGVQAKYLFATHADFQALDITYAEYVRSGFVELLIASAAAAVISYALILKQHALQNAAQILKLKWVNGVLLVELLLLLASAAKRDWMYIETYGITRVRLIGAIFLVWLLCIIVLIIALNFIRTMSEKHLLAGAAVTSAAVVLALNTINIDRVIALSTPPNMERPDIVYISQLSADAVDGWFPAMDEAQARYDSLKLKSTFTDQQKVQLADSKIAMASLDKQMRALDEERPWQEWNAGRTSAVYRLEETGIQQVAAQAQCLLNGIRDLQILTKTDLYAQEYRRMNEYYSPFVFSDSGYFAEDLASIILPYPAPTTSASLPECGGNPVMSR